MNDIAARGPRNAWLLLLVISAASFGVAEYLGDRHVAIATILVIAGLKVGIILFRFMELGHAPRGIRIYFMLWTAVCTVVPFALWWAASA
jgi:heme/copper-type cytochrome/quinol oxidase subunit 4